MLSLGDDAPPPPPPPPAGVLSLDDDAPPPAAALIITRKNEAHTDSVMVNLTSKYEVLRSAEYIFVHLCFCPSVEQTTVIDGHTLSS